MKANWLKSTDALISTFWELVPSDPRIQRKQMFGYPCAVIGGNMFMSLHRDRLVLRLPESQIDLLVQQDGYERFEPMPGRSMKGFVAVSPDRITDGAAISRLIHSAFDHGAALPVKQRTPRKPRAAN